MQKNAFHEIWTFQRIITERGQNSSSPLMEAAINVMLATAVDHLIDIFHLSISGMKSIFNFFIIVGKDSL